MAVVGGFDATDYATPPRPPDATVAAGPQYLLVGTNDSVSLYKKDGRLFAGLEIERFFASVLPDGEDITDPRAVYDPQARRYFLTALALASGSGCDDRGCPTQFLLAVSRSDSPAGMGANDWYLYQMPPSRTAGTGQLPELDFSSISVTAAGWCSRPASTRSGLARTTAVRTRHSRSA